MFVHLAPQVDDLFAKGDFDEMCRAVELMDAAGLEAADARDKLKRVMTAVKKVRQCPPFTLKNRRTVLDRLVSCMYSSTNSSRGLPFTLL